MGFAKLWETRLKSRSAKRRGIFTASPATDPRAGTRRQARPGGGPPNLSHPAGEQGKTFRFSLLVAPVGHDVQDGLVGLAHALFGQDADVADGGVHALGDDALAAPELLAVGVHLVAQDARVHAGGDFRRAGGLGPVADGALKIATALTMVWEMAPRLPSSR